MGRAGSPEGADRSLTAQGSSSMTLSTTWSAGCGSVLPRPCLQVSRWPGEPENPAPVSARGRSGLGSLPPASGRFRRVLGDLEQVEHTNDEPENHADQQPDGGTDPSRRSRKWPRKAGRANSNPRVVILERQIDSDREGRARLGGGHAVYPPRERRSRSTGGDACPGGARPVLVRVGETQHTRRRLPSQLPTRRI